MKNILTIDFDIIMAPSIDIYNDRVPQDNWEELMKNPLFELLEFDSIHYKRLTDLILFLIQNIDKDKIIFIGDHARVLNYLPKDEEINLVNIDHHHDLGYGTNPYEDIGCGNWVYFVKNLKEYTWIKNKNSMNLHFKTNINLKSYDLVDIKLDEIIPKVDYIFLCLSEPWIPPYFRPLFYTWVDIISYWFNNDFKIDFKENPIDIK